VRAGVSNGRTLGSIPMSESVTSYCTLLLVLLSLPAFLFPSAVRADHEGFFRNTEYNEGEFGDYVTQSFHTTDVTAPILNVNKPFTQCDDGSYIFITPRGEKAPSHPFILDHSGAMIWSAAQHYGQIYNFQVQRYRDEDYLCFWAGNDAVGGHGVGKIYMVSGVGGEGAGAPWTQTLTCRSMTSITNSTAPSLPATAWERISIPS